MLCAATDKPDTVNDMTVVDDNYTGHVEPRTAARRTLPGASIVKVSVGPMDNNAYLVTCSQTGETLLIDAANDAEILLELIERYAPKLSLIVTSHQHQDHWLALAEVAKATGVPTAAHQLDADPLPVKPDRTAGQRRHHRDRRAVLRRHPPAGSHPGIRRAGARTAPTTATHLFTGDCLFPGGVGKTGKPAEFDTLLDDVTTRVFDVYSDATVVYPGHGDDTTLGAERPHLEEWRERRW